MKKIAVIALMFLSCSVFAQGTSSNHEPAQRPDREAVRAAVKSCREGAGMTRGVRPTKEQMAKVRQCIKDKGFNPPPRPGDRRGKKVFESKSKDK